MARKADEEARRNMPAYNPQQYQSIYKCGGNMKATGGLVTTGTGTTKYIKPTRIPNPKTEADFIHNMFTSPDATPSAFLRHTELDNHITMRNLGTNELYGGTKGDLLYNSSFYKVLKPINESPIINTVSKQQAGHSNIVKFQDGTSKSFTPEEIAEAKIDPSIYFKKGILIKANGGKLNSKFKSAYANGGYMEETRHNPNVTYFATGGTHEQNKNGGIPVGNNNFVEQGEVKYKNYIFSNRF
jgi:hypothetical protein